MLSYMMRMMNVDIIVIVKIWWKFWICDEKFWICEFDIMKKNDNKFVSIITFESIIDIIWLYIIEKRLMNFTFLWCHNDIICDTRCVIMMRYFWYSWIIFWRSKSFRKFVCKRNFYFRDVLNVVIKIHVSNSYLCNQYHFNQTFMNACMRFQ